MRVEKLINNLYLITEDKDCIMVKEHMDYGEHIVTLYMSVKIIIEENIRISNSDFVQIVNLLNEGHIKEENDNLIKELSYFICDECDDRLFN